MGKAYRQWRGALGLGKSWGRGAGGGQQSKAPKAGKGVVCSRTKKKA